MTRYRLKPYLRQLFNLSVVTMRLLVASLLVVCCGFASCDGNTDHHGRTPIVSVNGMFLYQDDIKNILPVGMSSADSTTFVENYIRNWVEDALLYRKAERNISDDQRIQRLVENYRRALVMHEYQQKLIGQQLLREVSESELQAFYEQNKNLFKADETLIKGLFIKVPLSASEIKQVRRWYRDKEQKTVDKLEKLSLSTAADYMYFYDRWIPASTVLVKIPLQLDNAERYLSDNRQIEVEDSLYGYFLNIDDVLLRNQEKPFEVAREDVKSVMLNLKQADFMRNVKADLYEEAMNKDEITYYYFNK